MQKTDKNNTQKSKHASQQSFSFLDLSMLNSAQKQAVQTTEGPLLIIAGPGTGKTTLLSYRIANILQTTDVPADAVLALTFTESGVVAMKNKLAKLIGPEAYKVNIFTFHGFCNYVIGEYSNFFADIAEFSVLSDLERIMLFDSILSKLKLKHFSARFNNTYFLKQISSFIGNIKREGIDIARLEQIIKIEKQALDYLPKESNKSKDGLTTKYKDQVAYIQKLEELLLVYRAYQEELKNLRKYDYEDMIDFVVKKLETNKEFLSVLQERFVYVLLDEYQDTNTAQNRVVFKLAEYWGDKANIFAVGDDDQSIYRFQGASVSNILDFINTFKTNLKIITLTENYRSQQNVLDVAYELIKHSQTNLMATLPDINKHLHSNVNIKKQPVYYGEFTSNIAESLFIVDKIKELKNSKTPLEEIAILVRNHWHMDDIIDLLQRNNIPYVRVGGDNALENPLVAQLLDLLRVVSYVADRPSDDAEIFKVMHFKFLDLPYTDVIKFARFIALKNREKTPDAKTKSAFEYVMDNSWQELAQQEIGLSTDGAQKIKQFFDNLSKWYNDSYNNSLAKYIEIIINESGLLDYILTLPSKFEDLNALNSFFLEVKALSQNQPFMPIEEFLKAMDLVEAYNIKIKVRDLVKPKGGVQVLTAHASKGLEFDYVFVPKFTDKFWGEKQRDNSAVRLPNYVVYRDLTNIPALVESRVEEINNKYKTNKDNPEKIQAEEDARRLFYVALTRARKTAFITFPQVIIAQNGKDTEYNPSRFVKELPENLVEPINTEPYNKLENEEALYSLLSKTKYANVYINTVSEDDYLQEILNRFKLSPSALIAFLKDPEEFYLNYLLKVPSVPNVYAAYGTAFHKALQEFYTYLKNTGEFLPYEQTLDYFKQSVENSLLLPDQKKDLIERAQKELKVYLNANTTHKRMPIYMEKYADLSLAGVPVTGVLDLIEYIDKDKGIVRIVDFKTGQSFNKNQILGKASTRDTHTLPIDEFKHKFKLQLYFYKILFDLHPELSKGGRLTATHGRIEFVQPKKGANWLPYPVDIEYDKSDEETLKQIIIESWKKIKDLEFLK